MTGRRISFLLLFVMLMFGAYALGRRASRSTAPPTISAAMDGALVSNAPIVPRHGQPEAAAGEIGTPGPVTTGNSGNSVLGAVSGLRVTPANPQSVRQLLIELEKLRQLGPAALPAIREFLASGRDADYDTPLARSGFRDGRVPAEFVVPPSLRLALLEVVKNIGGPEATELLAQELRTTGRGVEAAYIATALQQIAPGRYQDAALAAARDLLSMPLETAAKNPLDRADREYLYGMLAAAGDRSQLAPAQAQLVLPGGGVDRGALRFLQQSLGEEAVAIAAQAWDDPRIAANQRQPLAALALAYVGVSARAEQLWEKAINDPQMPPDARKDLIEDLNQEGFTNLKQLTAADLPLIQRRLALIDQLAPRAKDAINAAAFAEARKDLVEMRERVLRSSPPKK